ncbi:hypothetical protein CVT25_007084 [Psilocybe cyanescens]|uniref:Uncharacterized protein n=1 Tax=Psilocybe cyanescens TaxID=93625 RepID=A0A409XRD9_PSICY|nr:hypothetical protein CVT25_007084 [Psilocybe cyanescens]
MTRRSPSYQVRLAKYSQRSFGIYVPTLERSKIGPTVRPLQLFLPDPDTDAGHTQVYERSIVRTEGLAGGSSEDVFLQMLSAGNAIDVRGKGTMEMLKAEMILG